MNMVAGFLFNPARHTVALVCKKKPEWQRGKFNAIGGKMEPGETKQEAMRREFKEETGMDVTTWRFFCEYHQQGNIIYFFETIGALESLQQMEEESIWEFRVDKLHGVAVLPNLHWLVPMALDRSNIHATIIDPSIL